VGGGGGGSRPFLAFCFSSFSKNVLKKYIFVKGGGGEAKKNDRNVDRTVS